MAEPQEKRGRSTGRNQRTLRREGAERERKRNERQVPYPPLIVSLFKSKCQCAALWFDRNVFLISTTTRHLMSTSLKTSSILGFLSHTSAAAFKENSGGRSSHFSSLKRCPPYPGDHLIPPRPRSSSPADAQPAATDRRGYPSYPKGKRWALLMYPGLSRSLCFIIYLVLI
jgi:hypothetical protein